MGSLCQSGKAEAGTSIPRCHPLPSVTLSVPGGQQFRSSASLKTCVQCLWHCRVSSQ